jgi:hypothetical protein
MLIQPQHPDDCHPEKQGPMQQRFSMAQAVTPTIVSPLNRCPGGPQFSVSDFKFH